MAAIGELVAPVVYGVGLLAIAAGLGSRALAFVVPGGGARVDAMATALGLGIVAQVVFIPAALGLFSVGFLAGLAGVLLVVATGSLTATRRLRREAGSGGRARQRWPRIVAAGLGAAGPLLLALYPPTAWDATTYHLPLARRLVETGRFGLADNLRFPIFPLASETLFGSGLALAGPCAAQAVSVIATLLTAALLLAWGSERLGNGPLHVLPAALWLGHPIVVYHSGTATVEPLLAMAATAALLALDRWRRGPEPHLLVIAGAAAGWAAATKYLGLALVAFLVCVVAFDPRGRDRVRAVARLVVSALAAALPWYLLILVTTGNPVFPFLPGVFGTSAWSPSDAAGFGVLHREAGESAVAWLRLSWDVVFDRARVGLQPPFSPFVLALVPAAVWAAGRAPWTRWLVAGLAAWSLGFMWLPADSRYLMPLAPAAGMVLAVGLDGVLTCLADRPWRDRLGGAAVVAALVTGPAYAAHRVARLGWPPLGSEATARYLGRALPLVPALQALDRESGGRATTYGLRAERVIFYNTGRQIGDWVGPYRYSHVKPLLSDPERLWQRLHSYGASYLLLPVQVDGRPGSEVVPGGPELERRFRLVFEDSAARLLALRPADGE